jgi:hypothetical protein
LTKSAELNTSSLSSEKSHEEVRCVLCVNSDTDMISWKDESFFVIHQLSRQLVTGRKVPERCVRFMCTNFRFAATLNKLLHAGTASQMLCVRLKRAT